MRSLLQSWWRASGPPVVKLWGHTIKTRLTGTFDNKREGAGEDLTTDDAGFGFVLIRFALGWDAEVAEGRCPEVATEEEVATAVCSAARPLRKSDMQTVCSGVVWRAVEWMDGLVRVPRICSRGPALLSVRNILTSLPPSHVVTVSLVVYLYQSPSSS